MREREFGGERRRGRGSRITNRYIFSKVLQCVVMFGISTVLQYVALCCSVLQHVERESAAERGGKEEGVGSRTGTHSQKCCGVLYLTSVAACCSVLQRVAACCCVLKRVGEEEGVGLLSGRHA